MATARKRAGIGLLAGMWVLACGAQDVPSPTDAPTTETSSFITPTQLACCELPEGTPVRLEILDPISSARAKRGDAFRVRVQEDVGIEGIVVLPAGTEGVGEIVHAEPSRGGGKPGELILAARRLQLGDPEVRLRGLKLGGAGKDTSGVALGVAVGIGPFAHFIHGKEIEIPALTTGTAKLAEPLQAAPTSDASGATADPAAPERATLPPSTIPSHQPE